MDFYAILELEQLKAIHSALEPSLDSIWRMRCREYSTRFCTPLHVVMYELSPSHVLQALEEERFTPRGIEEELEQLHETLMQMKDPSYTSISKEDLECMVDNVLNREIKRMGKKNTSEVVKAVPKKIDIPPKKGSMNFGDLERLESESESSKGFED